MPSKHSSPTSDNEAKSIGHPPRPSSADASTEVFRLNKFLAERIGISRREADELISSGRVIVNGTRAKLGARVDKNDKVCYNGSIIPFQTDFLYLAMHKPVGYVCSRRPQGTTPTIYNLLPQKYHRLKTVGRLDKDSSGLILLTNDGDFAYRMTHPKFRKTKIYEIELDKSLSPLHQQMISDFGVLLDDGPSRFKVITWEGDSSPVESSDRQIQMEKKLVKPAQRKKFVVILAEGRNRQIRRTFAALGYKVTKLHRTHFGTFELKDLPVGKFQIISPTCGIIKP